MNAEINRWWGTQTQWIHLNYSSCIYDPWNIMEEGIEILSARIPGSLLWNCLSWNSYINKGTMAKVMDMLLWKDNFQTEPGELLITGSKRISVSQGWFLIGCPLKSGQPWNHTHTNNKNRFSKFGRKTNLCFMLYRRNPISNFLSI